MTGVSFTLAFVAHALVLLFPSSSPERTGLNRRADRSRIHESGIRIAPDNLPPSGSHVMFPTAAVPAFVTAGSSFTVLSSQPVSGIKARGTLACQHCILETEPCHRMSVVWACPVRTSPECDEGVYDLEIKSSNFNELHRASLRIVSSEGPLVMVITADHQLQDPTWRRGKRKTPGRHNNVIITRQEISEISAIAPDVAIHLGDLIFGAQPREELKQALDLWNRRDFAMNFLPGNHDGYALYDVRLPALM